MFSRQPATAIPKSGDRRTRKFFAWWPLRHTQDNFSYFIWLEYVTAEEVCVYLDALEQIWQIDRIDVSNF